MIAYLKSLPEQLSFYIFISAIIAIVVIALKGKLMLKFGKNTLGLGGSEPASGASGAKCSSSNFRKKRSCGDCVLIMMGEREKHEFNLRKTVDRILKTQMTFAEQKLIEVQTLLIDAYASKYSIVRNSQEKNPCIDDAVQNKLFYGLLKDVLLIIKDEIRRSYKDNNFYNLGDLEFSNYVKDKTKTIMSILNQHIRNIYPSSGVVVDGQGTIDIIESTSRDIEHIILEMYIQAKETKMDIKKQIDGIQKDFGSWIDTFLS